MATLTTLCNLTIFGVERCYRVFGREFFTNVTTNFDDFMFMNRIGRYCTCQSPIKIHYGEIRIERIILNYKQTDDQTFYMLFDDSVEEWMYYINNDWLTDGF